MAPKGKTGGKPAAQPAKAKAEKPHILCIRCPDPNTHDRLDPKTHTLIGCVARYPSQQHEKELWYGFKNGTVDPDSLPSDRAECQKLLDHVQNENKRATQDNYSWDDLIEATKTYRQKATYHKQPVYKEHLKHALQVTMAPRAPASQPTAAAPPAPSTAAQTQTAPTLQQAPVVPMSSTVHGNSAQPAHAPNQQPQAATGLQQNSHRDLIPVVDQPAAQPPASSSAAPSPTSVYYVRTFQAPQGRSEFGFPLRTELATPANSPEVLTNHFSVNIPAGQVLYEYHVLGLPDKATRAKKRTMILDMIEHDEYLFTNRHRIATDCQKKIMSDRPLYSDTQEITVNNFTPGSRTGPQAHTLRLEYVNCHQLNDLRDYARGQRVDYVDRGAADALNIVLSKAVSDGNPNTFQVGSNRFYYRQGWTDLKDGGLVATRGYFSSIRPAMGGILLNVKTVTSPFFKGQQVSEYLQLRDLKNNKKAADEYLHGLRVSVNFNRQDDPNDTSGRSVNDPSRRTKTLAAIGEKAKQQYFPAVGQNKVTVWDHLRHKYPSDTPNEAADMFSCNVGKKDGKDGEGSKYYLATQLTVLSGQPYKGILTGQATKIMILTARRDPRENYRLIMGEGMTSLRLNNANAPAQSMIGPQGLGLTISADMVSVPSRRIEAVDVQYKSMKKAASTASLDFGYAQDVYLTSSNGFNNRPSKDAARIQYFYVAGKFPTDTKRYDSYAANFERQWMAFNLQKLKLATNEKFIPIANFELGPLKNQLAKNNNKGNWFDLAVLIFPKQDAFQRGRYANFRIVADQFLGISSICFCEDKILGSLQQFDRQNGVIGPNTLKDYMRNISMKLNLRCGNTNHSVEQSKLSAINGEQNICNTMILGADVTHPGAGSIPFSPSIAAVVGTIDNNFSQSPGSMRLNKAPQEWIEDMEEMTLERLRLWYEKNNKKLPEKILYYRDGVGDSYLTTIRQHEVTAIHSAWTKLKAEKSIKTPSSVQVTAVVVTKRHHTRLYPLDLNGNCPPGTVVDSGITHPYFFDFYLQSHNMRKGTAKPSHYLVIENGMNLSPKQLQDLTYALCFTYGRSTTSVSYAPHAYYADRLCERGRLYLKPFQEKADKIKEKLKSEGFVGEEAKEMVMKEASGPFYRQNGKNPWHKSLDGKMFWM